METLIPMENDINYKGCMEKVLDQPCSSETGFSHHRMDYIGAGLRKESLKQ